jgi:hypothetical protein
MSSSQCLPALADLVDPGDPADLVVVVEAVSALDNSLCPNDALSNYLL